MFFWVSKIVWALVSPANLAVLALGGGVLLRPFFRRAGAVLCAFALGIIMIFGVFPTGANMLVWLERQNPIPEHLPTDLDGILVLGGMFETRLFHETAGAQLNDNADRAIMAIRLARANPGATIIFAGGTGFLRDNARTEDMDARDFLTSINFPTAHVMFENKSRNTWENIIHVQAMVSPTAGQKWALVTSAYHMPRAMALARAAGWGGIMPVPTDIRTSGTYKLLPTRFDVVGGLHDSTIATKELLGMAVYRAMHSSTRSSGQ